jgi:tRNA (guanine10-N2)-methyltransferase
MQDPDLRFQILEEYELGNKQPKRVFLGRWLADSDRQAIGKYDLKKRRYISTTSMDAELALVTANMVRAASGKLIYDPFVGTASLLIACAHKGAMTMGSDIDGRSIRGNADKNTITNYQQYGLLQTYLDSFVSDLTHTPLRPIKLLDGIVCDPPYGVREGLKVLGTKDGANRGAIMIDGVEAHLRPGFIYPKKPYSFDAMLDDILDFAANMLVEGGRLCMWMPSANEDDVELAIPHHPALTIISICVQPFNKWSRRLLTYQRLSDNEIPRSTGRAPKESIAGSNADDLNHFRKRFFEGFKPNVPNSNGS